MDDLGYVWARVLRGLLAIGEIRKAILGGIAVGAVVGLIIALVKGYWPLILVSCGVGSVAGTTFGLIIRFIRITSRRNG